MANGFRMLVLDLEAARSAKLLASGTPFHGHSGVWRSAGEAKERMVRDGSDEGQRKNSIIVGFGDGKWNWETWFYTMFSEATTPQSLTRHASTPKHSGVKRVCTTREYHVKLCSLQSVIFRQKPRRFRLRCSCIADSGV